MCILCILNQLSYLETSVTLGTRLIAPPVTNKVGFPARRVSATLLISLEDTESILSIY
jgi:hypothetical protein